VKAAEAKVAKIQKQVDTAKEKLATLKQKLKEAKLDVKTVTAEVKEASVKGDSKKIDAAGNAAKAAYDNNSKDITKSHEANTSALQQLGKLSLTELKGALATAFGKEQGATLAKLGKTKTGILKKVEHRLTERTARRERGEVIAGAAKAAREGTA
jgi:hypothetical protein